MALSSKPFDSVQMMRPIRDELDKQIKDITFEQEQAYIREHLCGESMGVVSDSSKRDSTQPGRLRSEKYG